MSTRAPLPALRIMQDLFAFAEGVCHVFQDARTCGPSCGFRDLASRGSRGSATSTRHHDFCQLACADQDDHKLFSTVRRRGINMIGRAGCEYHRHWVPDGRCCRERAQGLDISHAVDFGSMWPEWAAFRFNVPPVFFSFLLPPSEKSHDRISRWGLSSHQLFSPSGHSQTVTLTLMRGGG